MADTPNELLRGLLKDVSRSFYLTLRVLPESIRSPVGLAYLLARTTDTIADTGLVSIEQRELALQTLRERILGTGVSPVDFGGLARHQGSPAERMLLKQCESSLDLLQRLSESDRQRVRTVLDTITGGQELDLRRFAGASPARLVALRTDEELEDYTYRVAGCVGEFWTRMCRAHLFPDAALDDSLLLSRAVRFGKGLQLVNILRDLPADLQKGRCYFPEEELRRIGLAPADLLQPANEPRLRPAFHKYLDRAMDYLAAGWVYTNTLPWRHARVRLACAWPILIGVQTIGRLRASNALDPRQPVKILRREVRRIVAQSVLLYPWPNLWRKLGPIAGSDAG
ncbi:MAG: phytoene/squalene synthase family protein [Verrucomicrobiota bacterium]